MASEGFACINVGRTRTGKTTLSKSLVVDYIRSNGMDYSNVYIYDVNKEYYDYYKEPFVPYNEFINNIKDVTNSFILIEEATIFFNVKATDKLIQEMLVRKRHTNNIIYLNFHSIRAIPRYVFDLVNYVTIFKTNDTLEVVKTKYDDARFLKAFTAVNTDEDPYKRITFNLY